MKRFVQKEIGFLPKVNFESVATFFRCTLSYNNSKGADDCSSECDLDHILNWDFKIHNNDDEKILMTDIQLLTDYLKNLLAIIC